MLQSLRLEGVGPAKRLETGFGERLNLITGDNGLGKSFLLDVAWWALTRTWPRHDRGVLPREGAAKTTIHTRIKGKNGSVERSIEFDFQRQVWIQPRARPQIPGLVLYAQVDGGFSVWDPARNYWKIEGEERPAAFVFDSRQVWTGLEEGGKWRCNGLYRDWASWQREPGNESFRLLRTAMERLSPPGEMLRPGPLRRLGPDDSQDYPTIEMPYGISVPVNHASAAIRRVLALSYLLIWAWQEHLLAASQRHEEHTRQIVFIIDEAEAHLHPKWQRRILPSLFDVVKGLAGSAAPPAVQVIASTHSPLVCVSLETLFDDDIDRLIDLDFDRDAGVRIETVPFTKLGTGENWLLSRNFDLPSTYSEEAETALRNAGELVDRELQSPGSVTKRDFLKLDKELRRVVPDIDSFWVRWRRVGERNGWLR